MVKDGQQMLANLWLQTVHVTKWYSYKVTMLQSGIITKCPSYKLAWLQSDRLQSDRLQSDYFVTKCRIPRQMSDVPLKGHLSVEDSSTIVIFQSFSTESSEMMLHPTLPPRLKVT